jgi:enoyl-CoA hydratase/carnithine racemase
LTPAYVTYDDQLAELVLDSPPVNQFSVEFLEAVRDAVRSLSQDTRALVVSSSIDGVFAAGGDVSFMATASIEDQLAFVELCQETLDAFEKLPYPVVFAIDGACLGGGLELALAGDIRVAGDSATLGLPEVRLGILPGAGGTHRLVHTIGGGNARDLLLTGRRITGREAGGIGLVTRVVADGQAATEARALGRGFADGATDAIRCIKRLALGAPHRDIAASLVAEREEWEIARRSATGQEGLVAFAEKRRPDFRRAEQEAR